MPITATNSNIIRKNANAAFYKGLQGMPGGIDMKQFATTINTSGRLAEFGWFGGVGAVNAFTGAPQYRALTAFTDTITPTEWEMPLAFREDTFEDDATGTAATAGSAMVARCNDHINVLLSTYLENGTAATSDTAYDGQWFFDGDHHGVTDAAHDNDLTGAAATGTDPTSAELEAAVGDMLEAALGFVQDDLTPYVADPRRFKVVVPTEFAKAASIVLGPNGTLGATGMPGTYNRESGVTGIFGLPWMVDPHLANADTIYLLATPQAGSIGPFVVNMRRPWEFKTWDSSNSESCAAAREVRMQAYARYGVGYGVWQDAVCYIFT